MLSKGVAEVTIPSTVSRRTSLQIFLGKAMATKTSPTTFENFGQQGTAPHRELLHYVSSDVTFPTAYLKAVASIASSDGVLNVAEFNALNDVTSLLSDSA